MYLGCGVKLRGSSVASHLATVHQKFGAEQRLYHRLALACLQTSQNHSMQQSYAKPSIRFQDAASWWIPHTTNVLAFAKYIKYKYVHKHCRCIVNKIYDIGRLVFIFSSMIEDTLFWKLGAAKMLLCNSLESLLIYMKHEMQSALSHRKLEIKLSRSELTYCPVCGLQGIRCICYTVVLQKAAQVVSPSLPYLSQGANHRAACVELPITCCMWPGLMTIDDKWQLARLCQIHHGSPKVRLCFYMLHQRPMIKTSKSKLLAVVVLPSRPIEGHLTTQRQGSFGQAPAAICHVADVTDLPEPKAFDQLPRTDQVHISTWENPFRNSRWHLIFGTLDNFSASFLASNIF